jgi:hypothetical protein
MPSDQSGRLAHTGAVLFELVPAAGPRRVGQGDLLIEVGPAQALPFSLGRRLIFFSSNFRATLATESDALK